MEQLIPVINKLQDVVAVLSENSPIDLPQIVVVGAQSSGKSSVLEAIVGRDFLPRGSGIVTRRPLILQLVHRKVSGSGPKEWGEFTHAPGKKFEDFNEIRREIEADTDRISGKNKGISSQPINLKIFSPSVVNLTLVDLPGLTKVPVGDQPKDIAPQIRKLVMQYIKKENSIILAVSPANSDLANSDALKLAREVDPQGTRTVGVLTKVDLMDKGTDCFDILQGRVYQLRLGFVGVVLRSQEDIIKNRPIEEARAAEELYFKSHHLYKQIANRCGIPFLAKNLNKILMNHIRETLPDLRSKVNSMLQVTRVEMEALGDPRISVNKSTLLLHIINTFVHNYCATIDGRLNTASATEELYGGARINYIFNDVFGSYIDEISSKGGLTDEEIQITMTNATGPKASLFVPEESFEQLARRQVKVLEDPSLRCVDLVYDELQRIVNCIEINELKRFDNLQQKMTEVVGNLLRSCKAPCQEMIKNLISIEVSYINTNHPDFIGGGDAIAKILQRRAQRQIQQQQQVAPNIPNELQPQYQKEVESQLQKEQKAREREEMLRQAQIKKDKERELAAQKAREKKQKGGNFFTSIFKKKDDEDDKTEVTPAVMTKVPQRVVPKAAKERNENEDFQTELIELLLKSYFKIVRKNIKDRVPKSIMFFLVNASKEKIQNELVKELYKEDQLDALLAENDDVFKRREQLQQTLKVCTSAQRILNEIVDFKLG